MSIPKSLKNKYNTSNIVNVAQKKELKNNDIVNRGNKERRIEYIANELVKKFNSPQSYKLFCRIAYKNPETLIWRYVGEVKERSANNPAGYFVWLIKRFGEY